MGLLKRRARYLLSGCRLPTNWWGMATLAAAQLQRADAGLEPYPRIPFGTRVMIVRDPVPRNAFVPRAEPGTIFAPSSSVPTGFWTYQKGHTRVRTHIQAQGCDREDLTWIKVNLANWDPPDGPQGLPDAAEYDAASLVPLLHADGGATWRTVKCPACLQQFRHRAMTEAHTLVWGECMRALPPPPVALRPLGSMPSSSSRLFDEVEASGDVDATAGVAPEVVNIEPATADPDIAMGENENREGDDQAELGDVLPPMGGPEMALNLTAFEEEDEFRSGTPGADGFFYFERMVAPFNPDLETFDGAMKAMVKHGRESATPNTGRYASRRRHCRVSSTSRMRC